MSDLDLPKTLAILDRVIRAELSGVVRYTHYALMVTGPYRQTIVDFLKAQATESLMHAQEAGEIMTGLEGHPTSGIEPIKESNDHSLLRILEESLEHEIFALNIYKELLSVVEGASIYLEEYTRGQIRAEELHVMDLKKMLRDFTAK